MCGVATKPFRIWYSKQRRELAVGVPSGCKSRYFNIAVTLNIIVVLVSNPYGCSSLYFLYCLFPLGDMRVPL